MAQVQQVPRPVRVAFDVAEHDRRRGRQAGAMRLRDDVQPLLRAELVGCELVADLVIEDFCGSARQRAEAGALQFTEKFGNGNAERSEEHTSELQSLMRISYAVFRLKKNIRYSNQIKSEY